MPTPLLVSSLLKYKSNEPPDDHKCWSAQVMSEILTGIRVIKFYAWENNFIRKILQLRYSHLKTYVYMTNLSIDTEEIYYSAKKGAKSIKYCSACYCWLSGVFVKFVQVWPGSGMCTSMIFHTFWRSRKSFQYTLVDRISIGISYWVWVLLYCLHFWHSCYALLANICGLWCNVW